MSGRACVSVCLLVWLTACYSFAPVINSTLPLGTVVALDITDAGRVALGGSMGPEIGQVEGRLVQNTNGEYIVAVSTVKYLRGGEQKWTGERISIKSEHVSSVKERRFSKKRSGIFAGAALSAVALLITRSIIGSGQSDPGKMPGDTLQSVRIPRL